MITRSFVIPENDIKKLEEISKRDDLNISQVVRRALKKFIEEKKYEK